MHDAVRVAQCFMASDVGSGYQGCMVSSRCRHNQPGSLIDRNIWTITLEQIDPGGGKQME
jgi:hypothetical protein